MSDTQSKPLFERRVLLDLRGLVKMCMHGSGVKDTVLDHEGNPVTAASSAVSGFIRRFLLPALQDVQPIALIAVLEGANHNMRRRQVDQEYKAAPSQGDDNPTFLEQQQKALVACQRIIRNLGGLLVQTPYAEADDTIGYLVRRMTCKLDIYTVDQDMLALYEEGRVAIRISDRHTGALEYKTAFKGIDFQPIDMDAHPDPALIPKYPTLVRLYKSIVGDTSDGYKGVKGAAAGAMADIIAEFGYDGALQLCDIVAAKDWDTLSGMVDATAPSTPKGKKSKGHQALVKLFEHRDAWQKCWWLAGIHDEWCEGSYNGKITHPQWSKRLPSREKLAADLEPLGLLDMMEDLEQFLPQQWLIDSKEWNSMVESQELYQLIDDMNASPAIGFDFETYDAVQHAPYQQARKGGYVDVLNSKLTGASFCYGANLQNSFYLSVLHRDTANVSPDCVKYLLEETETHPTRVAHHAKFEEVVAKVDLGYSFPVDQLPDDTMITGAKVDEDMDAGLKKMALHWLGYVQTTYRQVVPEGQDMRDVSGAEVMAYGADDSFVCAHLFVLHATIMECESTFDFYKENEPFFDQALLVPFIEGVPVNWSRLAELEHEDDVLFEQTETRLRGLLQAHCSEVNEAGFKIIAPEILEYKASLAIDKAEKKNARLTKEEIDGKAQGWLEEIRAKCRYVPFAPPPCVFAQGTVSQAARSLGLPAMRSIKQPNMKRWLESVLRQSVTLGMSAEQAAFVAQVEEYLATGEPDPFHRHITEVLAGDREFWLGSELNAGSSLQMGFLFYGMLGLPIRMRNEVKEDDVRDQFDLQGAPSTNENAIRTWMVELAENESDWRFQVLSDILTIRGIRTRRQLYYKPWPLWKSPITGRIHPQFRNCGTRTHRPSGTSPNLYQVTKHKDKGRMRSCVLPQTRAVINGVLSNEPQVIVSIDLVQQEMALLAGFSRDPNLLACYTGPRATRKDVHTLTSTAIINYERGRRHESQWTYEMYQQIRQDKKHPDNSEAKKVRDKKGKPTNFLLIFGGGPSGLARKLIVPLRDAEAYFDGFYKTYARVRPWQEEVIKFARKHGYVKGAFGSRKHLRNINSKDGAKKAAAERQAINWFMQNSAAEILKKILRRYVLERVAERTGATLIATIYDEALASVPVSQVYLYIKLMEEIMQMHVPGTDLTLDTSVSLGNNWGEQIELNDRQEVIDEALVDEVLEELMETRQ